MNIHIITLNIPWPVDYGGMIDSYYRIKALHDIGTGIHLHCFEYGRPRSNELEILCKTVSYYKRKTGLFSHLSLRPYTVNSRRSKQLVSDLLKDDYPIFFDGLHTTFCINDSSLRKRKKIIRLHNIEHGYYFTLSKYEKNPFKKIFFRMEAYRLKKHQKIIRKTDLALTISENDQEYFSEKFKNVKYLAPFHPFKEIKSTPGQGNYLIYHGDLSVNENAAIVEYLINNVISKVDFRFIVAGKNPDKLIRTVISGHKNVELIADPSEEQMKDLIENAQINILPAFGLNGFKIKILIALYSGRHCIVNNVLGGNELIKKLCHVSGSDDEMISMIGELMNEPFTEKMAADRKELLETDYNTGKNATRLVDFVARIFTT